MLRSLLTSSLLVLLFSVPCSAQGQVTFNQSNVASATQAQGFTYKLYVTPVGASSATIFTLSSILCGGTAPNVNCSTVLPTAAAAAKVTGSKSTITATDSVNKTEESLQSDPFFKPTDVPTNLKVIP